MCVVGYANIVRVLGAFFGQAKAYRAYIRYMRLNWGFNRRLRHTASCLITASSVDWKQTK